MAREMNPDPGDKFEVFFDAQCPMCRKEIDMVRRMDANRRLILTDIAANDFDPVSVGKPLDTLMQEIHGRHSDGRWLVGVEVFREIYGRVGFERLASISRLPIVRTVLDIGYKCFAWPRYRLALRRMRNSQAVAASQSGLDVCEQGASVSSCRQIASAVDSDSAPRSVTID